MKIKYGLLSILCTCLLTPATWAYEIEQVTDKLYRFIDDRHRSVFLVTHEGIILTDPLNPKAARWLKQALAKRFDKPVKYVIYSHNHSDHIYGGEVFDQPGVTFIAHELVKQDIQITRAKTRLPDTTFTDQMNIQLGNARVELRYHGPNDGRGSISMLFPEERSLFVVDWIVLGRMPWRKLWSYDIRGMINSTREVLSLDFDTFIGGHADVGSKAEIVAYLDYLESLQQVVVEGILAGKSLEQIQQTQALDRFSHLPFFTPWLKLNIEGVYERMMEESGMGWRPDVP